MNAYDHIPNPHAIGDDHLRRNYTLYRQDVSHLYTTYDLLPDHKRWFDDLPINSGHAFAYYAVSPSDREADYIEQYLGTYWPANKEWVSDHVIDLMVHRAQVVHDIAGLYPSEVEREFRKYLEGV